MVEGVDLAGKVAQVAEQLDGLGQAGGGGRVVAGQMLQQAELVEHAGLAGPVPGPAGRDEGRLVLARGLVPVTAGAQEAAHRGGDGDGMQRHVLGGGVADGRVQVGALGFQPGGRFAGRGQLAGRWPAGWPAAGVRLRWSRWRCAGWRPRRRARSSSPACRRRRVNPRCRRRRERAGVLAQQVVQQVAAGRRLGEQMMVVELIELAAGGCPG